MEYWNDGVMATIVDLASYRLVPQRLSKKPLFSISTSLPPMSAALKKSNRSNSSTAVI